MLTGWHWLLVLVALGFLARVVSGPTLSVLGQLATRVIAPRLGPPKLVAGPPKRFAQGIGLIVTTAAAVASLGFGLTTLASVLVALLLVFATLESVVGFCTGCWLFGRLMQAGLIPEATCQACNNITWGEHRAADRPGSLLPINSTADPVHTGAPTPPAPESPTQHGSIHRSEATSYTNALPWRS